jgi:hypothetical protein
VSEESARLLKALSPEGVAGLDHDIRYLGGNLREALAHYRILFPELISYRGGLFIESHFDKQAVDEILDASAFDAGDDAIATAEQHVNAVSLAAEDDEDHFDIACARASAAAVGWVWVRWIRDTYSIDVRVQSSISGPDDCSIWFESGSNDEARLG